MNGCREKVKMINNLIVLEQLVETLPADGYIFVKGRKPKSTMVVAKLANDYIQARKQEGEQTKVQNARKPNKKHVDRNCLRSVKGIVSRYKA